MEGITNAFYGETFKYILLLGSIGVYVFIAIVLVLKQLHKGDQQNPGAKSTKGKKTSSIEGNDMMSLWEEDNLQKDSGSLNESEANEEDNQYEEVFDNAINQVKDEEESSKESTDNNIDIEFDDDEDDDEELRNILNLDS